MTLQQELCLVSTPRPNKQQVRLEILKVIKDQLKGVDKKTLHFDFCFAHISSSLHRIFKILAPTPHNLGRIMWGRHKNFKDRMYRR